MQEEIHKRLHAPVLGPCACSQVRRLGRKLSSLYDTLLSPEDLTITQYSLLADIERAGQLSHAVLAEKGGMQRTTLTGNLRPLTRAKWVVAGTGKDRRQHLFQLTAPGRPAKALISLALFREHMEERTRRHGVPAPHYYRRHSATLLSRFTAPGYRQLAEHHQACEREIFETFAYQPNAPEPKRYQYGA